MKASILTLILALAIVSARRGRWGGGGGRHYGGHGGYWGWRPRNFCQSSLGTTCNANEKYFEQIIADVDLCNRQCPKFPYQKCHNNNNKPSQICINQVKNFYNFKKQVTKPPNIRMEI